MRIRKSTYFVCPTDFRINNQQEFKGDNLFYPSLGNNALRTNTVY